MERKCNKSSEEHDVEVKEAVEDVEGPGLSAIEIRSMGGKNIVEDDVKGRHHQPPKVL